MDNGTKQIIIRLKKKVLGHGEELLKMEGARMSN